MLPAKDQWDSLEWSEDEIPDTIQAAEVNKRLLNADTVDHVIAHLMENGVKVECGDRLGKTIVFAKNQDHADFIERRFDKAYPKLAGKFARVITHQTGAIAAPWKSIRPQTRGRRSMTRSARN